jgi:hypothetical protein
MLVFCRGEVLGPRYLTSCLIGMRKLLILTCGQIVLLVVNVICVDNINSMSVIPNACQYKRIVAGYFMV